MADEDNQGSSRRTLLLIMGGVVGGTVLVSLGLGIGYMIFGGSASNPSAEVEQIIERSNPGTQPVEEQVSENELAEEGEEGREQGGEGSEEGGAGSRPGSRQEGREDGGL